VFRIAHHLVEVNHAVKGAAGTYPLLDLLPLSLLCLRIVSGNGNAFERHQSTADYLNTAHVGARNQLPVGINQVFRGAHIRRVGEEDITQFRPWKAKLML
jgi:hypothetical protein